MLKENSWYTTFYCVPGLAEVACKYYRASKYSLTMLHAEDFQVSQRDIPGNCTENYWKLQELAYLCFAVICLLQFVHLLEILITNLYMYLIKKGLLILARLGLIQLKNI